MSPTVQGKVRASVCEVYCVQQQCKRVCMTCLCLPVCRFSSDQGFTQIQATRLETMNVIDGTWYVSLKGDYAGRVSGAVYDIRNQSNPVQLAVSVSC